LKFMKDLAEAVGKEVMDAQGVQIKYKFGTMIEIPRAAVTAAEVATHAEFFSFGTNDLTQMTYGYSRDDAERNFLITYQEQGILETNPFQSLDRSGVGKLMDWAISEGRKTRPSLEVGICGEHGGDPSSIEWCHIIGNNYVSCSPFRVPIARLAAAHAALKYRPIKKTTTLKKKVKLKSKQAKTTVKAKSTVKAKTAQAKTAVKAKTARSK